MVVETMQQEMLESHEYLKYMKSSDEAEYKSLFHEYEKKYELE